MTLLVYFLIVYRLIYATIRWMGRGDSRNLS